MTSIAGIRKAKTRMTKFKPIEADMVLLAHSITQSFLEMCVQLKNGSALHRNASSIHVPITASLVLSFMLRASNGQYTAMSLSNEITTIKYMLVHPIKNITNAEIVHPIFLNDQLRID